MEYQVIVDLNEENEPRFPAGYLQEVWYATTVADQPRHRENGPCYTVYKPDTLERVMEQWQELGVTHRVGGPATTWTLDGIRREEWEYRGHKHRLDGPAVTSVRLEDNCILEEEWFEFDKRHRIGGPAIIKRDPETTQVVYEAWYKFDKLSRWDGPSEVHYDARSGEVKKASFYREGKKQRGPCSYEPTP